MQVRNAAISSIFFVSNNFFASHAGYFDSAAQHNPLLHTWSLSIEEQFYIIFPILLLAIRNLRHQLRLSVLGVLMLGSLGASIYLSFTAPDTAYYSIATRAWELAIGGLLAIAAPRKSPIWMGELLGIVGLLAILIATATFDASTTFPGYAALLPTLGAAALLYSGTHHSTVASRLLSWQPMRVVGLMSYSLYLWHWPILVFMRQLGYGSRKEAFVGIMICFVIAWLSWRFVEQPFRKPKTVWKPSAVVTGGVVAMVLTTLLAISSVPLNAFLLPMTDRARTIAQFDTTSARTEMREGICFLTNQNDYSLFRTDVCLALDSKRVNVLLMGDSHAAQYYEALRQTNPEINIIQATSSGCLPLLGASGERNCRKMFEYIVEEFLPENHVDMIVLAGRWREDSVEKAYKTAEKLLAHTNKVVIVGTNAEFRSALPRVLVESEIRNEPDLIKAFASPVPRQVDKAFQAYGSQRPEISYVSYFSTMCRIECPIFSSTGEPLIYDTNHLTLSAAMDFLKAAGPL